MRTQPLINNLFTEAEDGKDKSGLKRPQKSAKDSNLLFDLENEKKEIEGPKLYLLKLIEFNKIAILEKQGYSTYSVSHHGGHIMIEDEQQINEVQQCMTRLMRQTVI